MRKNLPSKMEEFEALTGSQAIHSSQPIKGLQVKKYKVTTTIVCFIVLTLALVINGLCFFFTKCEFFLYPISNGSDTPLFFQTPIQIPVYV